MECPTSRLYFLHTAVIPEHIQLSVHAKKTQVTSGIFSGISGESLVPIITVVFVIENTLCYTIDVMHDWKVWQDAEEYATVFPHSYWLHFL